MNSSAEPAQVHLNIGGNTTFAFTESVLRAEEGSMLACMFSNGSALRPSEQDSNGAFLVPGDATLFACISQHLHGGTVNLHNLSDEGLHELRAQCDFYQLKRLQSKVDAASQARDAAATESEARIERDTARSDARIRALERDVEWLARCDKCTLFCCKPRDHWGNCKLFYKK